VSEEKMNVPCGDAVFSALDARAQSYVSREAVEDVLIAVRSLIARQPAAIDKQDEIARIRYGALRDAENIARLFDLGTPDGHAIADSIRKLAEAERAGQTAAPSVEQDERGAFAQAAIRMLEGYAESYESMSRMNGGGNKVQCSSVAFDIRHNMAGWIKARAASTPANVAQGAEAVGYLSKADLDRLHTYKGTIWPSMNEVAIIPVYTAAPPAQKALTDDARDSLRSLLSHCWEFKTSFDKKTQQPTAIKATFKVTTIASEYACDEMGSLVADFLTAAQSASGDA
jgi:hypothetical protein